MNITYPYRVHADAWRCASRRSQQLVRQPMRAPTSTSSSRAKQMAPSLNDDITNRRFTVNGLFSAVTRHIDALRPPAPTRRACCNCPCWVWSYFQKSHLPSLWLMFAFIVDRHSYSLCGRRDFYKILGVAKSLRR